MTRPSILAPFVVSALLLAARADAAPHSTWALFGPDDSLQECLSRAPAVTPSFEQAARSAGWIRVQQACTAMPLSPLSVCSWPSGTRAYAYQPEALRGSMRRCLTAGGVWVTL